MKILLHLNAVDENEVHELNGFIREKQLKGILPSVVENQLTVLDKEVNVQPMMGGPEYVSIIQMLLGSTVAAAGVKGLFDIIKGYFDIQKQKIISNIDLEKAKVDATKIVLVIEDNDGNKKSITLNTLDDEERKRYNEKIDEAFKAK